MFAKNVTIVVIGFIGLIVIVVCLLKPQFTITGNPRASCNNNFGIQPQFCHLMLLNITFIVVCTLFQVALFFREGSGGSPVSWPPASTSPLYLNLQPLT